MTKSHYIEVGFDWAYKSNHNELIVKIVQCESAILQLKGYLDTGDIDNFMNEFIKYSAYVNDFIFALQLDPLKLTEKALSSLFGCFYLNKKDCYRLYDELMHCGGALDIFSIMYYIKYDKPAVSDYYSLKLPLKCKCFVPSYDIKFGYCTEFCRFQDDPRMQRIAFIVEWKILKQRKYGRKLPKYTLWLLLKKAKLHKDSKKMHDARQELVIDFYRGRYRKMTELRCELAGRY